MVMAAGLNQFNPVENYPVSTFLGAVSHTDDLYPHKFRSTQLRNVSEL